MGAPPGDAAASTRRPPGLGPWRSDEPPAGFVPFPSPDQVGSVGRRFLATAEAHPDTVALSSPAGRWTFAELREAVAAEAAALQQELGIDEPKPVALLVDHDGPLVVALVAVIVAGHVVVVVDPSAPDAQRQHVLAESGATLLLHDEANADTAAALVSTVPELRARALGSGPEATLQEPDRGLQDPIMLAFTSGTTGNPKGATVTQGVLLNVIRGATNALGITADDCLPMLFPTSLAAAAYPMFLPLLNGGTLATLDLRSVGLAPLGDFLADERISVVYLTPTVVRFLVDALAGRTFPDLRLVALGGEVVDADAVRVTDAVLGPERIANGFGTTETGVIALYVQEPGDVPEGAIPAGYPVPDVELQVLDDNGGPVAPGEPGEVAIASPYLFTGYWRHHDLDAQVLAPDPGGRAGWHLYRTGDLGRVDEHGALTVLGRADTKVKVRGRFVVLGDVEADLRDLDAVQDAVVTSVVHGATTELAAMVQPVPGADASPTALRAALLATREAYRVPTRWTVVDELPQLPNGKVDRRAAVAAAETAAATADDPASPPASAPPAATDDPSVVALRATVGDIWRRLLPIGPVGLDQDFTHAGGDSLLAAQMLVMVEQETGITVPMGELVHARTVRDLVDVMVRIRDAGEEHPSTASCVQPGSPDRPILWFVHDLHGSAYRVRHLAEALGPDQPVWSFESPLLRGEPNRATTLEEFVRPYVADLQVVQPEGPYWISGYSFGGAAAYEIARQLRAAGRDVSFCGIVDIGPGYRGPGWGDRRSPLRPWFGIEKPPPPGASAKQQAEHYWAMVRRSPKGALRHLTVRTGLSRILDPLRFDAELKRAGRIRPEWRLWYAWEQHWDLAVRRWPRDHRYDAPLDLFWADATPTSDDTMGWGPLVPQLAIHHFAGDHEGILEPRGVGALAAAMRPVLDQRLTRSPTAEDHP